MFRNFLIAIVLVASQTATIVAQQQEPPDESTVKLPPEIAESQAVWYHRYKTQSNTPDPAKQLLNEDAEPELAEGFVDLFNGRDLTGWTAKGGSCKFAVEGDQIVGTCVKGSDSTYLCTDRSDFRDFIFTGQIQWRVDGNTGVMFRSRDRLPPNKADTAENRIVFGPQLEMEGFEGFAKGRFWSGGIYGQSCGGYFYPLWLRQHAATRTACKKEGWNRVTLLAKGNVVKTWVNGVPMAHWIDQENAFSEGQFGLQIHSGSQGTILFRELKVKELN